VVSHEAVAGFLDPIREDFAIPRAFELQIQGHVIQVRHVIRDPIAPRWPPTLTIDNGLPTHRYWLVNSNFSPQISTWEEVQPHCVEHGTFDVPGDYSHAQLTALRVNITEGLLLEAVSCSQYRRVGVFTVEKSGWLEEDESRMARLVLI
jgi:hypothetical protein